MQGLTTKRHREPKQRTKPLKEERNTGQPSGMCAQSILGKMHAKMWEAWSVGRG